MIEAVIFDLDGTVVKHCIDLKAGKRELGRVVEEEGLKLDPTQLSIYLLLKRAKNLLNRERFGRFRKRVYEVVRKYELKAAYETDLVDGVTELIKWLKKRGLKVGLLTNNSSESVGIIDYRLKILRYFDVVITRDDVEMIKPDPAGLLLALKKLGTKRAAMVGDSPSDVMASKRAGIMSIGVASTSPYRELLILSGPDFLVEEVRLTKDVIEYVNVK